RAAVADAFAEPVELVLGAGHRRRRHRSPEPLRREVDRLLHAALAIAAPGRAGHDTDAVVLGHRDEARLEPAAPGIDDGCHPVDPPPARRSAEAAQHAVYRLDQMRLVLALGEHPAELARA